MDRILWPLKKGRHYKMEQFAAAFLSLTFCMALVVSACFFKSMKKQDLTLYEKALYTQRFTSSRTRESGTVEGLYVSSDRTRAFVVLRFENISNISLDAENYQMFLTWADVLKNPGKISYEPTGSLYVFGASGTMGILLENSRGFEAQILDLVIRANSELVPAQNAGTVYADNSFARFDQIRLYFNPGASQAEILPVLDEKELNVLDLYKQAVLANQEMEMRQKLDAKLEELKIAAQNIQEYTDRLQIQYGLQELEMPKAIAGDEIVEDSQGNLVFVPATVVGGGYDFDWRSGSLAKGYLKDLKEEGQSDVDFFRAKALEPDFNAPFAGFQNTDSWKLSDGTTIGELNLGTSSKGQYATINDTAQALIQRWQKFYSLKKDYQAGLLEELLQLESHATQIALTTSINQDEQNLQIY